MLARLDGVVYPELMQADDDPYVECGVDALEPNPSRGDAAILAPWARLQSSRRKNLQMRTNLCVSIDTTEITKQRKIYIEQERKEKV